MDKPPFELKALLTWGQNCLKSSSTPRLDAEILLLDAVKSQGLSKIDLYLHPEQILTDESVIYFKNLIERRMQGEPVALILGQQSFWTLDLTVSPDTLVPRPETETLIEIILEKIKMPSLAVLDLGTGTGAIALSLAKEQPTWSVIATDIHPQTLEIARQNAISNNIENVVFKLGDWFEALKGERFSIIASNPPYIDEEDPHLSHPSMGFEPKRALVSPKNGSADLEAIIKQAPYYLEKNGLLILEHGYNQGELVRHLLSEQGFIQVETLPDLAGIDRVTFGFWP